VTGRELTDAIGRAHALCLAEIRVAKYEYDGGRRKLATVRKARTTAATRARDQQIRDLRDRFAAERAKAATS
jgi:hypothetical protein